MIAVLLLFASTAYAAASAEPASLLSRADHVKTSDHGAFVAILAALRERTESLSLSDQEHLNYLEAWKSVYDGQYDAAIPALRTTIRDAHDVTLRFRANATLVNVLAYGSHYEEAFVRLGGLLGSLPQISDKDAREQALGVASLLYNQVGEFNLGLRYAEKIIEEDWADRGDCNGGQLKLEALYKSGRLRSIGPELQTVIDACVRLGELIRANAVRVYAARIHLARARAEEAISLLNAYYPEVQKIGSPRLTSEFDAWLASAYRETGNSALVRQHALRAIERGVKNQYTEPLVTAYRLLYLLAREQDNARDALIYHEGYAAADKGYLDDVTARQLAYQRVSHAAVADKLRIEALNKENQVLQLQRALDKKAVETSSLYITLLIVVLLFIALWAYRTKRSQLHFMRLSQLDGLTGISNRPRFIELAESALANGAKTGQEVCVVLCDLDQFKLINDRHGHAAGDFVLKQTVAACQVLLRTSDIFGRFGGEEFGIVLPGCTLEDAQLRTGQLRLAIAGVSSSYDGVELSTSASFGVASTASSGYELRQLLAHADTALYRAKHAGRNCVVLHDERRAIDALTPVVPA